MDKTTDRGIAFISAVAFPILAVSVLTILEQWERWWVLLGTLIPLVMLVASRDHRRSFWTRAILIGVTAVLILGLGLGAMIAHRRNTAPHLFIHDGALQTEAAARFLVRGINPYAADYRTTPFVATWPAGPQYHPNPAWVRYVYLPFHVLVTVPFLMISERIFGWYDQRFLYLVAFLVATVLVVSFAPGREHQLLVGLTFLLNPFWSRFFVVGFNDIFVFVLLAGCLKAAVTQRWTAAGILYGLAAASKQSAWFFAPFFFVFFLRNIRGKRQRFWALTATVLTFGLCLIPFFVWNPSEFWADTVRYVAGAVPWNYPISGMGFSVLLTRVGVIRDVWAYYPFWIWQLLIVGPVLVWLLRSFWRYPSLPRLVVAGMALSLVSWFFSRFFNGSYLAYLSLFLPLILALIDPVRFIRHHANQYHPANV